MGIIYARLINQYNFKHQEDFLARLDKQNEDHQLVDETELKIKPKL